MSEASHPIIMCDAEDGCSEWALDHYRACVSSIDGVPVVRVPQGWSRTTDGDDLCPEHTPIEIKETQR